MIDRVFQAVEKIESAATKVRQVADGASEEGRRVYGSLRVAVARQATPSPRPAKPSPSVVVALTETRAGSIDAIAATRSRIASRHEPILGPSQMSVASRWAMKPPRARTRSAAWAKNSLEAAPFHRGSEGGKWTPMSPSASAP